MKRVVSAFLVIIAILSTANVLAQHPDDKNWSDKFGYPGMMYSSYATGTAVFNDTIYILARDASSGQNDRVSLYQFDGTKVSIFPHQPALSKNGGIFCIAIDSIGRLWIAGRFTSVDGKPAGHVAMWNGISWEPVGQGFSIKGQEPYVSTLAASNDGVYAGGCFAYADGDTVNSIAYWSGSKWVQLDSGFYEYLPTNRDYPADIFQVYWNGSSLYTIGNFRYQNRTYVGTPKVMRWDGDKWHLLPGNFIRHPQSSEPSLVSIASFKDTIYVSGVFDSVDGKAVSAIVKFDGYGWKKVGDYIKSNNNKVFRISTTNKYLYASGDFSFHIGNDTIIDNGKWDGANWTKVVQNLIEVPSFPASFTNIQNRDFISIPTAVTLDSGLIYLGMSEIINSKLHQYVDSSQFGVLSEVSEMVAAGNAIYALGDFIGAGTTRSFNQPMCWDEKGWRTISNNIKGPYNHIFSFNDTLYLTGSFYWVNNDSASGIAKWDGKQWMPLFFQDLAKSGGDKLYSYPGTRRISVSKYGSIALTDENDILYLIKGNQLTKLGKVRYSYAPFGFLEDTLIALRFKNNQTLSEWNGTEWTEATDFLELKNFDNPNDTNGWITSLSFINNNIYIAGEFTHVNGIAANHIACWKNAQWTALGNGISDTGKYAGWKGLNSINIIESMTPVEDNLYVCGYFTTAGEVTALGVAKWNGSEWKNFGSGLTRNEYQDELPQLGFVRNIAIANNQLYAAGKFDFAGGKNSKNFAIYKSKETTTVKHNSTPHASIALSIFPNPSRSRVIVSSEQAMVSLSIIDELGRVVMKQRLRSRNVELNCAEFTSGTYYIEALLEDDQISRGKLVVY